MKYTWKKSDSTISGASWLGPMRMVRQEEPTRRIISARNNRRRCAKMGLSTRYVSSAKLSMWWYSRLIHFSSSKLVPSAWRSTSRDSTANPTTWGRVVTSVTIAAQVRGAIGITISLAIGSRPKTKLVAG